MTTMKSPIMTSKGEVLGTLDELTGVYSFKGIPFAAPPVGDLRWKAPQPVQPWSSVTQPALVPAPCSFPSLAI